MVQLQGWAARPREYPHGDRCRQERGYRLLRVHGLVEGVLDTEGDAYSDSEHAYSDSEHAYIAHAYRHCMRI